MARRDLAGLAALGALGYMMTRGGGKKAPVEERSTRFGSDSDETERDITPGDAEGYVGEGMRPMREGRGAARSTAPAQAPRTAPAQAGMSQEEMARRRLAGGPRGRTGPMAPPAMPSGMSQEEMARIRMAGGARGRTVPGAEPTMYGGPGGAERMIPRPIGTGRGPAENPVTGNEFTRNASNTMNALAGLSAPGVVPQMTQRQFNARAAARRAEEGLSEAEVAELLRRKALSEADTTGGAVGYKKGGKIKAKAKPKKMASGGMAKSVSKRADGIASKGKTKCKMY